MHHLKSRLGSLRVCSSLFALLLTVAASGCGDDDRSGDAGPGADASPGDAGTDAGPDAGPPPVVLYTEVMLDDDTLADMALASLGVGTTPRCNECHALTQSRVRDWGTASQAALGCIGDLDANDPTDAVAILDCFDPTTADEHEPDLLAFVTVAVPHPWFERVFDRAYGPTAMPEYELYQARASMPRGVVPRFEQPEIDVLLTWVMRGMPGLDDRVPQLMEGPDCMPSISDDVATHITDMRTEGWHVLNDDAGMRSYGCAMGEVGRNCLTTMPLASEHADGLTWGTTPGAVLRILHTYNYRSSYWTRSSADGRFVSHGGGASSSASIVDLQAGHTIGADALYDPGFFPDNSGFVIQGAAGSFCEQSLLTDLAISSSPHITFREPECDTLSTVGLYQHLGAVAGGDYWTDFGQFVSDNGGHSLTRGPVAATFDDSSRLTLVPIIHEGDSYRARARIRTSTPREGDTTISPSSRLLMGRVSADGARQSGYRLRRLVATPAGETYDVEVPIIGEYCQIGAKVAFSFDERWVVTHDYIRDEHAVDLGFTGPTDPGFAEFQSQGGANLFLMDLLTGQWRRITRMDPGHYALFPHFRSDGWIYFVVRNTTGSGETEYVVASDVALLLAE